MNFERDALPGERLARKGGLVSRLHLAPCIRPRLRLLDPVMRRKPRLDRLVVAAMRLAGEVERERLVGVMREDVPNPTLSQKRIKI